jgi:hypothetical protein
MTTYYLAGPMSGIPQFNFPLFYRVTETLRIAGMDVVSPAELDDQEDKGAAMSSPDGDHTNRVHMGNKTWADFLARDVKLIADKVQGIIFLPDWHKSRGARLEAFVGLLQKDFEFLQYVDLPYNTFQLVPMSRLEVLGAIIAVMAGGEHSLAVPT